MCRGALSDRGRGNLLSLDELFRHGAGTPRYLKALACIVNMRIRSWWLSTSELWSEPSWQALGQLGLAKGPLGTHLDNEKGDAHDAVHDPNVGRLVHLVVALVGLQPAERGSLVGKQAGHLDGKLGEDIGVTEVQALGVEGIVEARGQLLLQAGPIGGAAAAGVLLRCLRSLLLLEGVPEQTVGEPCGPDFSLAEPVKGGQVDFLGRLGDLGVKGVQGGEPAGGGGECAGHMFRAG